ncbi:MAG: DUF4476 domain-containing protein [Bacteroidia bacterium]|nr:DUF4476 domain-containing protein [Bacteroidia bacterium]
MFQKLLIQCFVFMLLNVCYSQNNSLVIFSENGVPFYLTVNGERINKKAETNIKATGLSNGWQHIYITIPGIVKEPSFKDSINFGKQERFQNKEFTYLLIKKSDKLILQFKSISEPSGPQKPIVPEAPKETAPIIDNSIYGNVYQAVKNKPVFFQNYNIETETCNTPLNDKDIQYIKNLIIRANDKEATHRYITEVISKNCYTVIQLNELLQLEPIDMDRLYTAKNAYWHISDIQNIKNILSVFKYPAMKESFENYIIEQENIAKQKQLNCSTPIDETNFNQLYLKLKNLSYDSDKLNEAKKQLSKICLSSIQIKKISSLFTHDREKLDFIKYALNIITDKENKVTLAEELQYQGSKEEFYNHIHYQP